MYTVSQTRAESGDLVWYAHLEGFSYIPVILAERHTFHTSKKYALTNAAIKMGLPYDSYMELRRRKGCR
jgi:hypothetical protein